VLARLFESTPLDFFVGFSSISAVIGAPGTSAYAAACAYIDAFVLSSARPRAWRMALSVAWDAWRDIGMAPRVVVPEVMRAARRAYVAAGISPADGAEAFGRVLGAGLSQSVVSPYEVDAILSVLRRERRRRKGATRPAEPAAPRAASAPTSTVADPPVGIVEETVASIWSELLGIAPVGAHDHFFELGGHSLLATRLLARIDDSLGVRLPLRAIFDAPTVRQLAALLVTQGGRNDLALETMPSEEREEFEL
jgi:acyl carrier protein